jgi:hypothetical protein
VLLWSSPGWSPGRPASRGSASSGWPASGPRLARQRAAAEASRDRRRAARAAEHAEQAAAKQFADSRATYLAALRGRYGRLDLEILTPKEQDEHRALALRSVYVPQLVRAELPIVELPKELLRRLEEAGEILREDLPDGVDTERLAGAGQVLRQRPAQPVPQVLGDPTQRLVVLLGDPGAGKSTLSRYLTLTLAGEGADEHLAALEGWLPLLVELRAWADPRRIDDSFLDYLDHLYAAEGLGLPAAQLAEYLAEDGRAVMVFDALDEVFDPQVRDDVTRRIAAFATRYPMVRVVVTSRTIGYRRSVLDAAGFRHYSIADLDREQIGAFVTRWYELAIPDDVGEAKSRRRRLLDAVDASSSLRELAGNPLLLTILAIIGRRQELPRDRRSVYAHAAAVLVEHWDVERHLRDGRIPMEYIDRQDKLELLQRVARRMQDSRTSHSGTHILGPDLLIVFEEYLRERYLLTPDRAKPVAKAMLEQFHERNFILSHFGGGVYGFVHRAFLEYFTATDIESRFNRREWTPDQLVTEVYGRHWADPAWHEVLLLVTGMIDVRFSGQAIDFLIDADPSWYLDQTRAPDHLVLALRCLGEVRKLGALAAQGRALLLTLASVMEEASHQLQLFHTVAAYARGAVLAGVRAVGPNWPGREVYLRWYQVRGGRPLTRAIALTGATDLAGMGALLVAALFPDRADVRDAFIADLFCGATSPERQAAAEALAAGWRDDTATQAALRRAVYDDDPRVRQIALRSLTQRHPDAETLTMLLRAASDEQSDVREVALQSLILQWPDRLDVVDLVQRRALTDEYWGVRETALRSLVAALPAMRTVELLCQQATQDTDPGVREAAMRLLAEHWPADPKIVTLIRNRALRDEDERTRAVGVQLLADTWPQHPATLDALRQAATADTTRLPREAAIRALATGWPTEPETRELICAAATATDSDVRKAALHALATTWRDDPTTPAFLHQAVKDNSHEIRQAALQDLATGWPDDPRTLTMIYRAARDSEAEVRQTAIDLLAANWPNDPRCALVVLASASTNRYPPVQAHAVRALAANWPNDPETTTVLHHLATDDKHPDVREAAMLALLRGSTHQPETAKLFAQVARDDQDWNRRRTAADALATTWPNSPEAQALLHEATTGCQPDLWLHRVRALANAGPDTSHLVTLVHHALAVGYPHARRDALQLLGELWPDDPATVTAVLASCADSDAIVRAAAVQTLTTCWPHNPQTLDAVHRAYNAGDHRDRQAAVHALVRGWPQDAQTATLIRHSARTDTDPRVRLAALRVAAAHWVDEPETAVLVHHLANTDPEWSVRQTALRLLGGAWPDSASAAITLRQATTDPDARVRQAAVRVLGTGWPTDPATVSVLHTATTDDGSSVRQVALRTLADAQPTDPATITLLTTRTTTDTDPTVRRLAHKLFAAARRQSIPL